MSAVLAVRMSTQAQESFPVNVGDHGKDQRYLQMMASLAGSKHILTVVSWDTYVEHKVRCQTSLRGW